MQDKVRVAVSGVGGGAGQSIVKALAETDYEVVALDGEVLGTGLYAAQESYVIPYANSPAFVDRVIEICQREGVTFYFPGLDAELPVLTHVVGRFKAAGITVMVSSPEVIALSDNKLLTHNILTKYGVSVPETYDLSVTPHNAIPLNFPFILKEREGGARSQNLHLVKDPEQFNALAARGVDLDTYVAQEYIEGDEYTCGSVNLDGECLGIIVMRRILRDGDTYKCFSVKNDVIEAEVRKVVTAIKPFGACNVQLRMKNGKPYVFEINARSSGTTAARALCGFNEPKMILDYLIHGTKSAYKIKEQTILRYWKELVVPNEWVETVKQNGGMQDNVNHPSL